MFAVILAAAACASLPEPVPIADPADLAHRLQRSGTPDQPQLIEFQWRYRGRDGRFSGEGSVRVNPPDSVRLDLLGPGWTGVQSAVLLGEAVYYIGEQRIQLPPPTFMWSMLGVFRPPPGVVPEGTRRGERSVLAYGLSERDTVAFEFDLAGRLVKAELRVGADVIQRIELKPADPRQETSGWQRPEEARFRDLGEFHEVRISVTQARDHAPFEPRIFRVAAR